MAKSGIYKVHLKSMLWGSPAQGGDSGWGEGTMYVIGSEIRNLFMQVVADSASPFAAADFTWEVNPATIQPHEQLVYFVSKSLIQDVDSNQSITTAGATFMITGAGVISEVNVTMISGDPHFGQKVARMAFHELMHNKLDADPNNSAVPDLHSANPKTPGTGEGMALHNVDWNTQLTPKNKSLYAKNLNLKIAQYKQALSRKFYLGV